MSRTTKNINAIKADLDSISGLDGIVADMMEALAKEVHKMVEYIRENYSEANLFDYFGTKMGQAVTNLNKTKEEIIYELVLSLNQGSSSYASDRVNIAVIQYNKMVENGIIKEG